MIKRESESKDFCRHKKSFKIEFGFLSTKVQDFGRNANAK
jgi:hypothetical protein